MTICFYKRHFYKQVVACLIALFWLAGCSGDKDDEPGLLDSLSAVKNMSDTADEMSDMDIEKRIDTLAGMTPVDFATLKTLLPETLLDMPQRKVTGSEGELTGVHAANALYGNGSNDEHGHYTRSLNLRIQDGAGEMGSAILGLLYATQTMIRGFGAQTEDDGSSAKAVSLHGLDVVENVQETKDGGTENCLNLIPDIRFVVSLCSESLDMKTMKKALSQIDFGTMKKLVESE